MELPPSPRSALRRPRTRPCTGERRHLRSADTLPVAAGSSAGSSAGAAQPWLLRRMLPKRTLPALGSLLPRGRMGGLWQHAPALRPLARPRAPTDAELRPPRGRPAPARMGAVVLQSDEVQCSAAVRRSATQLVPSPVKPKSGQQFPPRSHTLRFGLGAVRERVGLGTSLPRRCLDTPAPGRSCLTYPPPSAQGALDGWVPSPRRGRLPAGHSWCRSGP